ncbi:winged helix-turn-helix domain-containing protein [Solwaraspora sp. WMMB335]|uniref:winged helix-turn-helix domain-containing protein n=1 Tax=Solwaraspora sp. WMMB335 TaxID=3404118 RepID=UPI003B94EF0C
MDDVLRFHLIGLLQELIEDERSAATRLPGGGRGAGVGFGGDGRTLLTARPVAPGPVSARPVAAGPTTAGPPAVPAADLGDPAALRICAESRTVLLGPVEIPLTRREFDLLFCLASHPRRVFTRGQLLDRVWGHRRSSPRSVDVHVRRLRVKIGEDLPVVRTVHGVGYRLDGGIPVLILGAEI